MHESGSPVILVIGGIVIEACIFPAWIVELDRIEDSIDLLRNCCLAALMFTHPRRATAAV